MKKYTEKDLEPWAGKRGLMAEPSDLIKAPLWWHKHGLSQTASGYGGKLATPRKILFEGRKRRIYCTCYSNNGSCWFTYKGETVFIR